MSHMRGAISKAPWKRLLPRPSNTLLGFGELSSASTFTQNSIDQLAINEQTQPRRSFSSITPPGPQEPVLDAPREEPATNIAQPSQVESTSRPTVQDVWDQTTTRLLQEHPVGSLTPNLWGEAHAAILFWLGTDTKDSFIKSLELVDRLFQEEQATLSVETKLPDFYNTDLLNLVLNHWRIMVADHPEWRRDDDMHPQPLVERLQRYHVTTETKLRPNTQSFAMIIDAAATVHRNRTLPDGVVVADRLLSWIIQEAKEHAHVRPNVYTYSSLMHAWVKSQRREAPERVEDLLDEMEALHEEYPDWNVSPNQITYTTAIDAWAKARRVDRVEDLLQDMFEKAQEGTQELKPNLPAFNGYMVALARAGQFDKAEQLLAQMEHWYSTGELEEQPTVISYSTLLDAFAKSRASASAERAEAILRQMKDRGVEANAISWNTVIDAHVKNRNIAKAEDLLREMNEEYLSQGKLELKPTMRTYSMVLAGWSKTKSPQAGERGEKLLELMKKLAASGDLDEVDVVAYNSVLDCWAKAQVKGSADKAKDFLLRMVDDGVTPDGYSFNTVSAALIQENRLEEAEAMLDFMKENGVSPDATTYNTIMHAWIKSPSKDAPQRLQALHQRMKDDHNVEADLFTMNTLLHFYAKNGNGIAAQELLDEMCLDSSTVEPDSISFNTTVAAWARSSAPKSAERAEEVLDRMVAYGGQVKPNVITFNSVLNAWVRSRAPDALEHCQKLVSTMHKLVTRGNDLVQPDSITYSTLINAHGQSPDENAMVEADHIFQEVHRRFKTGDRRLAPTVQTYGALVHGWARSSHPDAPRKTQDVLRLWIQRARAGEVSGRPRVFEFIAAMRSLVGSKDSSAIFWADELLALTLQEYEGGNTDAKPESKLFTAFLRVLANSPIEDKEQYAARVVGIMKTYDVFPNKFVLGGLKLCKNGPKEPLQNEQSQL
eukprot:Nitzschia sp. Nitz4//scaffold1_size375055//43163//45991//NITZ4_000218-RA/size375055-processed-gene-0.300-mRNA-1//1//CDS//3329540871//1906//frame0